VTLAVVAASLPDALVGVFYDDGIYAALAQSLATGEGYRHLNLPGRPAAVHYPPLYPAVLAALWKLWPSFPANVVLLRGANALFMAVFAGAATLYFSRRPDVRPWTVAAAVTLAATAVPLLAVATVLFSEPLYLALAVAACWLADAARTAGGRRALGLAAAAGAVAGLAALTRSIGVAVIAGVVTALALSRRLLAATAAAAVSALFLVPWMAWTARHRTGIDPVIASGYGTYGDFLAQGGAAWINPLSLVEFARPLAAVALPGAPVFAVVVLALAPLAVLGAGLWRLVQLAPAAGFMLLGYLGIVALWPYGPDRFVWGALPWLAVAFALGLAYTLRRGEPRRWLRVTGFAAAAIVAVGFVPRQALGLLRGSATATQRGISDTFSEVLPWIRASTDTSAVIASEDEALIWLYTGRRAVPSFLWRVRGRTGQSYGADTLKAWLERNGVTHVVLTGATEAAPTIDDLIGRFPDFLRVVRVWPRPMMAFEVRRDGGGARP
jgi:hypothetical protein